MVFWHILFLTCDVNIQDNQSVSTYETAAELKCGCGNCPDMLDGLAGSDCCRVLRRWKEEYAKW